MFKRLCHQLTLALSLVTPAFAWTEADFKDHVSEIFHGTRDRLEEGTYYVRGQLRINGNSPSYSSLTGLIVDWPDTGQDLRHCIDNGQKRPPGH